MAYTVALVKQSNWGGNQRAFIYSVTADAATENIATDLKTVDFTIIQAQSFTSTGPRNVVNDTGISGTAIAGTVGASGFVAGDVFTMICVGR